MLNGNRALACWNVLSGALVALGCGSAADSAGLLQAGSEGGLSASGGMRPGSGGTLTGGAVGATGGTRSNGGSSAAGASSGGTDSAGTPGDGGTGGGTLGGASGSTASGGAAGSSAAGGGGAGGAGAGGAAGSGGSGGSASTPVTVTLTDFDDVYVDSCNPNANQGAAEALLVDAAPCIYQTLLKPSLGPLPSGATVTSATLTLVGFDVGGDVDVSTINGAWNEGLASWNNRPAPVTKIGSFASAIGAVSIDLTSQVQSWLNGEALSGLVLTQTSTDGSDYWSSEAPAASNRPKLVITYTP